MHQNNIFFKKIIFDINISERSRNTKKNYFEAKKKIIFLNFFKKIFLKPKNKQVLAF